MLQLIHIDKATDDNVKNGLAYWAKLFMAKTWEEFKALADGNYTIEEVGNLILELNYDNQAKELLEGRRRYREQLATSFAAGEIKATKKLSSIIDEQNVELAKKGRRSC